MAAKKTTRQTTKKTAPKKPAAKKKASAKTSDQADPRFEPVAKAFAKVPGFSLMQSKSKGSRGLMLNGKSFGMSHHGRFMLKLNEERAAAHIASGTGKQFFAAPKKPMKGWIEVTDPKASWVSLAKEAHQLASQASKPKARS